MGGWATKELKSAQLGDARRTKRLIKIVENLTKKPNSTVPEASENWADTKATYDFWDSPYIKPEQVRQPHISSTIERIQEYDCILNIEDTTELNYTNHPATEGIGYLDSKYSRGLKVHSTIAVTTLVNTIRSDKSTSVGKRYIRIGKSKKTSSETNRI